jgi:hypothetical protein
MRVASPEGRECYVALARSFLPSTTSSILQRAYPHAEMNSYNVNRLILHLQEQGCRRVDLRLSEHGMHRGVTLFFKKEALPLL